MDSLDPSTLHWWALAAIDQIADGGRRATNMGHALAEKEPLGQKHITANFPRSPLRYGIITLVFFFHKHPTNISTHSGC